jgi:hypothetical protein
VCAAQPTGLARTCTLRLTSGMNSRAVFILLGLVTLGAYVLGYQGASVGNTLVRATSTTSTFSQPVAFSEPATRVLEPASNPHRAGAGAPS